MALHDACSCGDVDRVRACLSNSIFDVNAPDYEWDGRRPIHLAAGNGSVAVLELLVNAGADPNAVVKGRGGQYAIHYAAQNGCADAIRWLIQHAHVDPNVRADEDNEYGQTPLHYAIASHKVDTVRALIEGGADVNLPDLPGQSPLVYACVALALPYRSRGAPPLSQAEIDEYRAPRHEVLRTLLQHGADPNLDPSNGEVMTPLQWAMDGKDEVGAQILKDAGAKE